MIALLYEDNYLAHHGIKGQRWGIRRYQNEDGSLTELGKKHYSVDTGGNEKLSKKFTKDVKSMKKALDKTDVELQKANAKKYDARARKFAKVGGIAATVGLAVSTAAENDRKSAEKHIKRLGTESKEWSEKSAFWDRWSSEWNLRADGKYERTMPDGVKLVDTGESLKKNA